MNQNKGDRRISVLVASRERPDKLGTMISSAISSASNKSNLEFCIWLDDDDNSYDEFLSATPSTQLRVLRGPRTLLNFMYNSLLMISSGDYILWTGDDTEFKTESWDLKMTSELDKFSDKIGLVYANDLGNYQQIWANIGMVHKNWTRTFGFLFSPHMRDNGGDGWITDVARQIGRCVYLNEVIIEHLQHRQGKSSLDSTYEYRNATNQWNDLQGLYRLLVDERRRDALYLASSWTNIELNFSQRYALSTLYVGLLEKQKKINKFRKIYFLSMSNRTFLSRFINSIFLKNHYRWK